MLNQQIELLTNTLRPHFTGNRSRIECMAAIILGMISAGTVNLAEVSTYIQCGLKYRSTYNRIQGFFTEFSLCLNQVASFVMIILPFDGRIRLVFDRTNWKFGQRNINFFVLAICYKTVAVPIFWRSLDKQGCSSDEERIELLQRFQDKFGFDKVIDLFGDREFASKKLLEYLVKNNLNFTLRIKRTLNVANSKGKLVPVINLFRDLAIGEIEILVNRKVLGQKVNICVERLDSDDYRIIITNHHPENATTRYLEREQIERMFSCLKSRGFNIEDTHITNLDKLERLLGVVTIAFCWAYKVGDYIDEDQPIERKNHGRRVRSIFKTGFIYLRNLFAGVTERYLEFVNNIALIFEHNSSAKAFINKGYI